MLLSVIIVSYEVKYFLEQCLLSVKAAIRTLEQKQGEGQVEVIVVDNASKDGTINFLGERFSFVKFVCNKENTGYARANNLGLHQTEGRYVLFLNPDTIIPEDIFTNCISFFQSHPSAGAAGLRMVDGSGKFLVESKRGFPTAWRSFCKLSGLSSLFPSSQTFAGYNLGHLNESGVFPIEAIAGAFMIVRREVLEKIGGFDERFFMYAEDIDLSKRIMEAGYENYYLGDCTILHFKGESTPRNKLYVKRFYEAMKLYVQKHYKGFGSGLTVGLMRIAISFRSLIANAGVETSAEETQLDSVHFKGDEETIRSLKGKLNGIVENEAAETWVLCEGRKFNFANLIESIQQLPESKQAMIHASGSHSIVGSFDKNKRGNTITFDFA
jgi:GT2 family glycosyltransferase